jgi:D-alanyl-D-alanine carboxypeptidase
MSRRPPASVRYVVAALAVAVLAFVAVLAAVRPPLGATPTGPEPAAAAEPIAAPVTTAPTTRRLTPSPARTSARATPPATRTTVRPTRAPTHRSTRTTKPSPTRTATTPAGLRGLTPVLAGRVADAFAAAGRADVTIRVNSGWRSRAAQLSLWRAAVKKYGSEKAARHWVLPPDESAHPLGRAVDIGPPTGAAWLDRYGYRYGLCRHYANEPWHFEARAARGHTCPALESGAEG